LFYDTTPDLVFLGFLTSEYDFRWCWYPPLGIYCLDSPLQPHPNVNVPQAAKDVASQDALVDIFERIESFFRRLETYTEVPTTEAMKDMIVRIMVEVFGIFAIVTKEIRQGRASELIPIDASAIADRNPEKYLRKLVGRRDIEDALSRLDRWTQEEARMAIVQVLKVSNRVEDVVNTVGGDVRGVDDKVKDIDKKVGVAIKGASSNLAVQ
jgi:hypothetical protein